MLEPLRFQAPTPDAEQDGWVYVVLAPGRYHLLLRAAAHFIVSDWVHSRPWRFLLRVPATVTVVYAGSLTFACFGGGKPDSIFTTYTCSLDGPVVDETQAAAHIAQTSFPQYGPVRTILMQGP